MMGGGHGGGGMFHGTSRGHIDDEVFGSVYNRRVVLRMIPYMFRYKGFAVIATLSMLVFTGTQIAVPWLVATGIDDYILSDATFGQLTILFAVFVGVAGLNWVSNYAQQLAMAKVGQGILFGLRRDMFGHLQKLSLSYYDKTEVGRIMSRVQGDSGQLQEFMALVVMTLGDMLSLAGIVVMLMVLNLKLGLISMVTIPILVLIMAVWQPFARKAFMRVRVAISIVNGALNENITGIRVVQSMNRQDRNMEIFDGKNRDHLHVNLFASRLSSGLIGVVDVLTAVSIVLALFFGARMVLSNELEIGALVGFILYIQRFFDPIRNLTMQYTQLQRSMASGSRIFDLLDTPLDLEDAPDAVELPRLRGEVEYRNLHFSYVPEEPILKNVNLHINPGETVAIVGPTGAGKTSMVSLLSRFYDVPRANGAILVDGWDIRDVTRNSLARQMSMVLQEPFLFSGTVRENIKYNNSDVTDMRMIEAAQAVNAHNFIMRLENGYDTFLAERGVNLSLGQRQLISFARAIVADPRVLILDEATANIDSYTEVLIQRALQNLLKERTAIVIAHRLSTIRGADKIVVLNLGEVVEEGTHDQLLASNGLYSRLYAMNYASIEEPLELAGRADGDS